MTNDSIDGSNMDWIHYVLQNACLKREHFDRPSGFQNVSAIRVWTIESSVSPIPMLVMGLCGYFSDSLNSCSATRIVMYGIQMLTKLRYIDGQWQTIYMAYIRILCIVIFRSVV